MRGHEEKQGFMFSYLSPEQRVPADHPLRAIKGWADRALQRLSPVFTRMYARMGRPSIPPERLLKAQLLIALYTVRSERLFCEMLEYNILFRWFLDMSLDEPSFDATTFTKNRDRLLEHDVARRFLRVVVRLAQGQGLLSNEHFTVDGTLVEAWASAKSFRPRGTAGSAGDDDDPGNVHVDFRGERRSNRTHQSTTDPEAVLARKGPGKEAKLSYGASALMENRHGLVLGVRATLAVGTAEREAAVVLLDDHRAVAPRWKCRTVGADRGYHTRRFVWRLRARRIRPHIACISGRDTPGLDGRTTTSRGYALSQRVRKRIEEVFGWMKTVGGFRRTRYRGLRKVGWQATITAVAYNLLRVAKLCPQSAGGPCAVSRTGHSG